MIVATMKNDHDRHHWSPYQHKRTSSKRALSPPIFWNVLAVFSVAHHWCALLCAYVLHYARNELCCSSFMRTVVRLCAPLCLQCASVLMNFWWKAKMLKKLWLAWHLWQLLFQEQPQALLGFLSTQSLEICFPEWIKSVESIETKEPCPWHWYEQNEWPCPM